MTDELVFYTNRMSRGRVVRWMLEEVGEPYKVEVLDYASTMKRAGLSRDQSDGQSAGAAARQCGRDGNSRDLRLSRRCISEKPTRSCAGRSPACALLPLAVLHPRTIRGSRKQQGSRFCGPARP